MATNPDWARRHLQRLLNAGCQLSFHSGDAGPRGAANRLAGPLRVGAGQFAISGLLARNIRVLELGRAERGGRCVEIGIWEANGQFAYSRPMRPQTLTPGVPIRFQPRELIVRWGEAA